MCMPWASSDNLTPHSPPLQVCEQHVPIDEYKANLKTIVKTSQSWGTTARRARGLLLTPPPGLVEL